jgi:hypothetical protein
MAGGDVIPTWTRWPFRIVRAFGAILAVCTVVVALGGAWPTALLMLAVAAWIAVYPWTWKVAYRLGYANGQLEPLVEWDQS